MTPAFALTCLSARAIRLSLLALLSSAFLPVQSLATEPMSELRRVYAVVLMSKTFHTACDQVVPQNADAHRAAYDRFARKHSVARISRFFDAWPNPVPLLPEVRAFIDNATPAIQARVQAKPRTCVALGAFFDALVVRKLDLRGINRLGDYFDGLLVQAELMPPQPEKAPPSENLAAMGTPVAVRNDDRSYRFRNRSASAHPLPPV